MDYSVSKWIDRQIVCFDEAVSRHDGARAGDEGFQRAAEAAGDAWSWLQESEYIGQYWAKVLREGRALAEAMEPAGVNCGILRAFLGECGSGRPTGPMIRLWLQSPEVESKLTGDGVPTNPEPADDGPWSVALPKTAWARISTGSPNARPRSAEQFLEDSKAERTNPPRGRKWRVQLDKLSADQREAYENRQQ